MVKEYRRKNFSKSFLLSALERAERKGREALFYPPCGACGSPARFEYSKFHEPHYRFVHNSSNCRSSCTYSREEFIEALLANKRKIYSVVLVEF